MRWPLGSRHSRSCSSCPGPTAQACQASSHREAPLIADPRADNTDLYAFVSPTTRQGHDHRQLHPARGAGRRAELPGFDDDVLYEIHVDNDGDAQGGHDLPVPVPHRRPATRTRSSTTPARSPRSTTRTGTGRRPTASRWSETGTAGRRDEAVLGTRLATPPDNIGPRSTPNYEALAASAVTHAPGGVKVFAGQRDDPFFVDLGSIFDLAGLRPFNPAHLIPLPARARAWTAWALQHPHDRASRFRSQHAASSGTRTTDHRHLRQRQPPDDRVCAEDGDDDGDRPLCPGLAARQPADQRGRDPARPEGRLEPLAIRKTTRSSPAATPTRRCRASRTCSTAGAGADCRRRDRRTTSSPSC